MSQLRVQRVETDEQIAAVFDLTKELRPHLLAADFVQTIRQQEAGGYVLLAGYDGKEPVCLAGYRITATLARGPHLFVDDLVTRAGRHGQGHGKAMLRHVARIAQQANLQRVYLDSRDSAVGFYRQVGFTFLTSVPCWIDVAKLCDGGDK